MQPHDAHSGVSSESVDVDPPTEAGSGTLLRLGWMVGGTLTMLIAAFVIASRPAWTFGARDAAFWGAALAAVALRYWDIKRFHGQTARGETATMADFRRYLVGLSIVAAGAWLAAQSVHV